jgi:hypothetical protein
MSGPGSEKDTYTHFQATPQSGVSLFWVNTSPI